MINTPKYKVILQKIVMNVSVAVASKIVKFHIVMILSSYQEFQMRKKIFIFSSLTKSIKVKFNFLKCNQKL